MTRTFRHEAATYRVEIEQHDHEGTCIRRDVLFTSYSRLYTQPHVDRVRADDVGCDAVFVSGFEAVAILRSPLQQKRYAPSSAFRHRMTPSHHLFGPACFWGLLVAASIVLAAVAWLADTRTALTRWTALRCLLSTGALTGGGKIAGYFLVAGFLTPVAHTGSRAWCWDRRRPAFRKPFLAAWLVVVAIDVLGPPLKQRPCGVSGPLVDERPLRLACGAIAPARPCERRSQATARCRRHSRCRASSSTTHPAGALRC